MDLRRSWGKNIILIIIIIMVITVSGCSNGDKLNGEDIVENNKEIELSQENKQEEITITDHLGRTIVLEKEADEIVSGYYITTSMLIALGLQDKVVGVEAKANSRPIYSLAAPGFLDLPNVGTAKEFNLEGTIALHPDLVILPTRLKDAIESLEKLGINVIGVNPEDMDLLKETLEMVGKATGTMARVDKLVEYYDEKNSFIEGLVKGEEKKSIYLGGNKDFLSTATKKMYQNYMIEVAGGENVADIDDSYWATISYEQLIAYNPEVIVIVPGAEYTKQDIIDDNKLSGISAIQNNEVYEMPSAIELWDSPIPSSILGTMWLTSILQPNDYTLDEFKEHVIDFYKKFYNIEIKKDEI